MTINQTSPGGEGAVADQPCRLLVVPSLNDSGPAHWQTWLQMQFPGTHRVYQRKWSDPDLDTWAGRIGETLDAAAPGPWVAAAHGFGCLALMRYLSGGDSRIRFALLVAPSDPARFDVGAKMPAGAPLLPSTMLASENDSFMALDDAREWARRWGSWMVDMGQAGHIDAEAGYGPLPDAASLIDRMIGEVDRSGSPARPAHLPAHSAGATSRPGSRPSQARPAPGDGRHLPRLGAIFATPNSSGR